MGRERQFNDAVLWGIFLVLGGIFILLNNVGFFGDWGPLVWPVLFAIAGLGFLGWHVANREQWGALIPGFTLLGLAATLYLNNRGNVPDDWLGTIFLASLGLGFWLIFLFHRDQWWAIIPGGTLWVFAIVAYLNEATALETNALGAIFFMGLGIVFGILYLLRSARRPLWWASIPAAALLLFGLIVFIGETGIQATYWPLLLIFLGLGLLAGQYWASRPRPVAQPAATPATSLPVPADEMDMPLVIPLQERLPDQPAPAAGRIDLQLPPEPASTTALSDAKPSGGTLEEPAWWKTDGGEASTAASQPDASPDETTPGDGEPKRAA